MYILFLIMIFIFLLIGVYYYYFANDILKKLIKNNVIRKIICIFVSIVLCFFWIFGLTIKSILTPYMIYLTIFLIIFNLVFILLEKYKDISVSKLLYLIPILLSLSICLYGKYNINNQTLTEYNIKSEKKINKNLKILYLSDCHYGGVLEKDNLDKMMSEIYKIKDIDLVLLGGDITDESTSLDELKYIYGKLSKINNNYGIFFVYGNHDGRSYENTYYNLLENVLKENKVNLLDDEYFKVTDNISIIGRKDFYYDRRELKGIIKEDLDNIYTILLDHQPKDYDKANELKIDLILSGHTHAGQIFPGGLLIDMFNTSEKAYGCDKIGNLYSVVSSGVSGWRIPVRTEKHSEYVIINVKN
ncbi:MAG: metallophosphoesterase [bacterium]|nr:metallophosphoesterase [bacterium]